MAETSPAVVVAIALALVVAITPVFLVAARRWGLLDRPNIRSSHDAIVPRGGGVVIVLAVLVALWLARSAWVDRPSAVALLGGGVTLAVLGLWDDRYGLSPLIRLAAQFAIAVAVVLGLGGLARLPLPPPLDIPLGPLATPVAMLWIVAVVNFFNFLDGIDGLAPLQAAVTGVGLLLAAWDPFVVLLGAALSGAAAGFLLFNWSPARIFLGDVGSYFLGYTLAALPLMAPTESRPWAVLFVASSLWLFLADASWTLMRRAIRGERWYEAHREHLYQHLARRWGHAKVTTAMGLGSLVLTAGALVAWKGEDLAWAWLVLGLGAAFFAVEWMMARPERVA
jgi:Fuc2NAc and GlcNAc transferase